uniref:Uncharacterized protein n=1 Tax=Panagrellus redivivus TaxID=6233 RepID=A0A7E4UTR0_PANRE
MTGGVELDVNSTSIDGMAAKWKCLWADQWRRLDCESARDRAAAMVTIRVRRRRQTMFETAFAVVVGEKGEFRQTGDRIWITQINRSTMGSVYNDLGAVQKLRHRKISDLDTPSPLNH